jgi:hypothetical protein
MISRGNITGLLQEVSEAMWDHQVWVAGEDGTQEVPYECLAAYYWSTVREGRKADTADYNTFRLHLTNPLVQMQWMCLTSQLAFSLEALKEFAVDFYRFCRLDENCKQVRAN